MKCVFIKWHRGDIYEKKQERKAAIKKAYRQVRQKTQKQLKNITSLSDVTEDCFEHPFIRISEYFD